MYLLYDLLLAVALIVSAPYWLLRLFRQGKYREGIGRRLGFIPPEVRALAASGKPLIWVHAVSVGEILAIAGLLGQMRTRFAGYTIAISSTTVTGHRLAAERFGAENVFFFPLDLSFAVGRYMRLLRPRLVVVAETEFWPNFLHAARRAGAAVAVVNARISDRSYPRYRRFRSLLRGVLANVDSFLAQSAADAERLADVGAGRARIHLAGNLKFDAVLPSIDNVVGPLRERIYELSAGPVVVFGSTVEGEEQRLIEPLRELIHSHPRGLFIVAPRHKERFAEVAKLLNLSGLPYARRSDPSWPRNLRSGAVLLLDTIGELAAVYSLAYVAFVGGSLAARGGHNILEPASFGIPILVGPHTENFRDIVRKFEAAEAVLVVNEENELLASTLRLLYDPAERRQLGERAAAVVRENQGATERTLEELERLLAGGGAR